MNKLNLEQFVRIALQTPDMKEYEEYMAIDASSVVIPAHVDRKIKRNIRRKIEGKKPISAKKITARILLVALIAMSIMFVTIMAYGETREIVLRAFVEWKDSFISVRYGDVNGGIVPSLDKNKEDATEKDSSTQEDIKEYPKTIEEYRSPSYVPSGIIEVPLISNQTMQIIEYYTTDEELAYVFEQQTWTDGNKYFDNEDAMIEDFVLGDGSFASFVKNNGKKDIHLVWNDGEYIYVLTSYLISKEEMINIANSVMATSDRGV